MARKSRIRRKSTKRKSRVRRIRGGGETTAQITRPGNAWLPKVGEKIDITKQTHDTQSNMYVITKYDDQVGDDDGILAIVNGGVSSDIFGATVTGFAHPNLTFTYK